jgi:hypothetical protein
MDELDSKRHLQIVAKAAKMVDQALSKYGEPTMTLAELREALDRELQGVSLSELIIKDRQAGW